MGYYCQLLIYCRGGGDGILLSVVNSLTWWRGGILLSVVNLLTWWQGFNTTVGGYFTDMVAEWDTTVVR